MIREALLTPNEWSRPQFPMRKIGAIVLHWVGNPGTTAEFNRVYFDTLRDRRASAHYIIDAWEIVRCVPESEVAYHCGTPIGTYTPWAVARWGQEHANWYCLGVEHCHPDWTGVWEPEVLLRSQILVAGLCLNHWLNPLTDIVLHHTITGKECPRDFARHPEKLTAYREAVRKILAA